MKRSSSRAARRIYTRYRFSAIERLDDRIAFDGTGIVTTDIDYGSGDRAHDVEIQADGKVIAVGFSTTAAKKSYTDFALTRYNADGSLDTSFSGDGKAFSRTQLDDQANAAAVQVDGRIVVAGSAHTKGNTGSANAFAISRYNSDGSLDTSFDGDGRVVTQIGNNTSATVVKIQTDQRIVAAGRVDWGFGLVRYNPNGSLDTSFGGTGKVVTDFELGGITNEVLGLVIQSDGKIVAGGGSTSGSHGYFTLARYNVDGTLDSTFGNGGKVATFMGGRSWISTLLLQPDGKIVAAGHFIVRYNSDGSLDTSFGNAGVVQPASYIDGLGMQSDGKIVLTARTGFLTTRLNPDGSVDPTFGSGGSIRVFATDTRAAYSLRVQADDKIVLVGGDGGNSGAPPTDFVTVRLTRDGALDTTFGAGASAAMSTLSAAIQTYDTTALRGQDSVSVVRLNVASIQELLAKSESTWTLKSRVRMRV